MKTTAWSTEKEYRVPADKRPDEDGLFSDWTFPAADLREVRLGPKIAVADVDVIRSLVAANFPQAKVLVAELDATVRRIVAR